MRGFVFLCALLLVSPARAEVVGVFREGAPKDRFVVENRSGCALGASAVTFDLSPSSAGLVFDVTDQGAGVEVFQPFEIVSGAGLLAATPEVMDGDRAVTLKLTGLPAGARVAFTIDVDDTKGARAITVSGSEIAGAVLRVQGDFAGEAVFSEAARARIAAPACDLS